MKEFRVWDDLNKAYQDPEDYYLDSDGDLYIWRHQRGYPTQVYSCKVEFWTGLTDSEGVKIFEGDKVKYDGSVFVIHFENAEYIMKSKIRGYYALSPIAPNSEEVLTVIGTIHEDEK